MRSRSSSAQGKGDSAEASELSRQLEALEAEHAKVTDESAFERLYQVNGATGLNASTNKDLTTYHVSFPKNRLELWAHAEAQRFAAPVLRDFYKEVDVVREERRMRTDSSPSGALYEELIQTAFTNSPYRWPTVGYHRDLSGMTLEKALAFHKRFYVPGNAVGAIVGDVRFEEVVPLLERTFGAIPAGPTPPQPDFTEPTRRQTRRSTVWFDANPMLMIAFHKPTLPSRDDYVFDVIETLLSSGRTSRLHRRLVLKDRLAQSIGAWGAPGARLENLFVISAAPMKGITAAQVEAAVLAELERLGKEPVVRPRAGEGPQPHPRGSGALDRLERRAGLVAYVRPGDRGGLALRSGPPEADRLDHPGGDPAGRARLLQAGEHDSGDARATFEDREKCAMTDAWPSSAIRPGHRSSCVHAPRARPDVEDNGGGGDGDGEGSPSRRLGRGSSRAHRRSRDIEVKPLSFEIIQPQIRTLENGIPVYLFPDRTVPLVTLRTQVFAGAVDDPADKLGLADVAFELMPTAGRGSWRPEALDELLEFHAANLGADAGSELSGVGINLRAADLDRLLPVYADVVLRPKFDPKRFEVLDLPSSGGRAPSARQPGRDSPAARGEGGVRTRFAVRARVLGGLSSPDPAGGCPRLPSSSGGAART